MGWHREIHSIPLQSFLFCEVSRHVSSSVPDFRNLSLLGFFLGRIAKDLSMLLVFSKNQFKAILLKVFSPYWSITIQKSWTSLYDHQQNIRNTLSTPLPTVRMSNLLFFNKLIGEIINLVFHFSFTLCAGEHLFSSLSVRWSYNLLYNWDCFQSRKRC